MAKKPQKDEPVSDDALARLMKMTKLLKAENVKVAPKGPPKAANKWRASHPTYAPKAEKTADTVEAGGMQVAPERQAEYENWRKDKIEEQNARRAAAQRHAQAAAEARKAKTPPSHP